jgi:multidrug efflux pump subunit AcrB
MIGAAFILTDPIFRGLAISLVFGLASSTVLTLLVIPAIYVWLMAD